MSQYEYRAWLMLLGLGPAYTLYFALQAIEPGWVTTVQQRLLCLAAAAVTHALVCLAGLALKRPGADEKNTADERDRAIDARATRGAYFLLMTGAVVVGMVMPFNQSGWKIVNAALFSIVLAEVLRNALIVRGYRGRARFAH